jgi:two-component system, OmpR family, sensor kinase
MEQERKHGARERAAPEPRSCEITQPNQELYDELERMNNEMVTMQRELAKKNAELERLNKQKNQFLGMASHDLRAPLSAILAYSELLEEEASSTLSEDHVHFLTTIKSSAAYMLGLVNELLDVSVIEAGKPRLDPKPVDLTLLVRHLLRLHTMVAEHRQVQLRLSVDPNLPQPVIDATKIEQVLHNLVVNALKFAPAGSTIDIGIAAGADQVVLSVRDEGHGIAASQLSRLFHPFETDGARRAGEKGAGLGLAIARRIIEAHHGTIWVESEVGRGATFYVALPLDPCAVDSDPEDVVP